MWRNRVCLTFLQLAWLVDNISADNQTGSLEFSTPPADADSFFPIEVHFRQFERARLFCGGYSMKICNTFPFPPSCPVSASGISIVGVVDSRSAEQLEFSQSQTVSCENVAVL